MIQKRIVTSVGIIATSLLVAAGLIIFSPEKTPTVEAGVPWFTSAVVVSSPKDPAVRTYEPGEKVNFRSDFIWTYCSNEGGGNIFGRITKPVPVGNNHSGFTGWRGGAEGQQVAPTASRKIGTGKGKRVAVKRPPVQIYKPRAASYTQPMQMPTRPGTYHFKYEIQIRTPEGNISREGRVVFRVKEREVSCPASQIEVTQNGATSCVPLTLDVTCSSSPSSAEVGDTVSFTATASESARFTWYEGRYPSGSVIGGPQTGTESTLTRTFDEPGIYQVTALAQNANGYGTCTRGVTVRGYNEEGEYFEEVVDEFGNIITDGSITTPDGQTINLNPSAGPATITLELDPTITNTTCKGTWVAQNVAKCYMVAGDDVANAPTIANSGDRNLNPAKYQVQCLSLKDGSIAKSPERLCRSNLNTRED